MSSQAVGDNGDAFKWTDQVSSKGYFGFVLADGTVSQLPLDGDNVTMGNATWTGDAPATQVILLHIADQSECDRLYGTNPLTCFVFPSSDTIHRKTPPFRCFDVNGTKFEDSNGDGSSDGDSGLGGWTINLILDGEIVNSTTTASDGSYSMHVCIKGNYTVEEVAQDGWVSTGPLNHTFVGSSGQNQTGLDFLNFELFKVSGYKYEDMNGDGSSDGDSGLEGWTVNLCNEDGCESTTTDANGYYDFTGIGPGAYTIEEQTQGGWVVTSAVSYSFDGASGENRTYDFQNFQMFKVSGYKYEDMNGDGSSDGDSGLEGWTVKLCDADDNCLSTTTDSSGYYEFTDVGPGSYTVYEETQDGWVATSVTFYEFDGVSGENQTGLDFLNFEEFKVSGYKYEDMNGDGSSDGDSGLEGWTVKLCDADDVCLSTTTDANGYYEFTGIGPGSYTVYEETQDGWVATSFTTYDFDGSSGTDQPFDFLNFEEFKVSGYKYEDMDGDGSSDGDSGLEGWTVKLCDADDICLSTTTDSNGYYEFTGIGPGSYTIYEETQDGWVATSFTTYEFEGASGTDQSFDFLNFEEFTVSGYKYEDMNGDGSSSGDSGLEGWTVKLCDADVVCVSTTTDANGYYEFTGIGPGSYTIYEETQDGWVATSFTTFDFEGASGTDQSFDFLNFEEFKVSGYKYEDMDGDGSSDGDSGLEGWGVKLCNADDVCLSTTTDANGYYEFTGIGPGSYTVFEETEDGWVATSVTSYSFNGASGTDRSFDFLNFEEFMVSGYKYEDMNGDGSSQGDLGLEGWTVKLCDADDNCMSTTTDSNGYYEFTGIGPGSYTVYELTQDGWVATSVTSYEFNGASGTDRSFNFLNFEEFKVSGYKYEDMNGDGSSDGDAGLEGWMVKLCDADDNCVSTTTDSNGYYAFTGIGPGSYTIYEETQDGWVATSVTSYEFNGASGTDRSFDFLNFEEFKVSGYKYEDANADGSSQGDSGLEGWTVKLCDADDNCVSTTTDSNGYYEFTGIGPGSYTVYELTQDGWIASSFTTYDFNGASGTDQSYDFLNYQFGRISGIKWYDANHNGEWNAPEAMIENLTIQLCDADNNCVQTQTDASGYFEFTGLTPGEYTVSEIMPLNNETNMIWAQTFPGGDGEHHISLTSGSSYDHADFGNVCEYTAGLTWGYWKTHTGDTKGAKKDPTYNLLATYPLQLDITTTDGDTWLESASEAYAILRLVKSDCSGDCRSLFQAQLIALYMNTLKFGDMGNMTYVWAGDAYDGMTVNEIFDTAHTLLLDGTYHDFTLFQVTLDRINNNSHYSLGEHVLVCTHL